MTRILFPALALTATPALAHEGLHFHPHGIEHGWIGVALIAVAGFAAVLFFRGRG